MVARAGIEPSLTGLRDRGSHQKSNGRYLDLAAGVGIAPTSRASKTRSLLEQPASIGCGPGNRTPIHAFRARRPAIERGRIKPAPAGGNRTSVGRLQGGCPATKRCRRNGVTYRYRSDRNRVHGAAGSPAPSCHHRLEVRAGLEPAYSRFAGGSLAFRTIAPLSEKLAPAESNRTLLRGFGIRVVPRTRRHQIGSPRWDRTSLVPG